MKKNIYYRCIVAATFSVVLVSCGGEDSGLLDKPTPPSISSSLRALSGAFKAEPNIDTFVPLKMNILGSGARLTNVANVDVGCPPATMDIVNIGFNVTSTSGTMCDYNFTIENGKTQAIGVMTVIGTGTEALLPARGHTVILSSPPVALNLKAMLGADFPEGYTVASAMVRGDASNIGGATVSGEVVTYTPPISTGWNSIEYTLSLADKVRMGSIIITISDVLNSPPIIPNQEYNFNTETNSSVLTRTPITIDLKTFGITDPEGDEWSLVEVKSIGADVILDVTNNTIEFVAVDVGTFDVVYVVSDHMGGYSYGIIKVTVIPQENPVTWVSLTAALEDYSAPLRYSEGVATLFSITPQWDSSVNNTISGYSANLANAHCSALGFVPSVTQMDTLRATHYTSENTTGELNKWPTDKTYLAMGNTKYFGYNILDGTTAAYNATTPYYVTCIVNQNIILTPLKQEVVANGAKVKIATITLNDGASVAIEDIEGYLTLAEVGLFWEDVGRYRYVYTDSTKAGSFQFNVVNTENASEVITSQIVNYIADITTARLDSLVITKNNAKPDKLDENTLRATILDAHENPVPRQKIEAIFSVWASGTRSAITNAAGQAIIDVMSDEAGGLDVKVRYIATATSVIGNSEITRRITFIRPTYCHQFPGTTDLNCLPTIEFAGGRIYTAAASLQFIENNYSGAYHEGTITESGKYGQKGVYISASNASGAKLCEMYSTQKQYGRSDWRMVKSEDLVAIVGRGKDTFELHGWPTGSFYGSTTKYQSPFGGNYVMVGQYLRYAGSGSGSVHYDETKSDSYISCVSDSTIE